MQTLPLGPSGRSTTRLGFGCSAIMGSLGRRPSLALLEAAYDAGIRHFDVAPMYGYGEAERCLGEFLARHAGAVTVTTKYGIPPAANRSLFRVARAVGGPLLRALPGLKRKLAPAARKAVPQEPVTETANPRFNAADARASFEASLAALRTDRIDLLLMHEARAIDLADENLLRLLEELVQQGKLGAFGVGSDAVKIPALLAERPGYCRVLQYEWSVLDQPIPPTAAFRIHHRSLTNHFPELHAKLAADPERSRRWSAATGEDLTHAPTLARLMLKAALVMNPDSVILFSSKQPKHIQANAAVAEDDRLIAPALRLTELLQQEPLDPA